MKSLRFLGTCLLVLGSGWVLDRECLAQCCLSNFFAGCSSCFQKAPPAYAVAPAPIVAPVAAPIPAPIPAPPPPVMVPVQQTSYVPETTYRTQYQCVPVTTYKPSCEIDPCTGCPRECMQPVTQYVQQAVNVPVTQYRAVTTTKYVQMQPGYGAAPTAGFAAPAGAVPAPAASPFASTIQTTPQAWGAAGADVPQQIIPAQPGVAAPALPATTAPVQTYQQPIAPQSGTYVPSTAAAVQPQATQPPALSPAPSLKPIPELPRTTAPATSGDSSTTAPALPTAPASPAAPAAGAAAPTTSGALGMPVVPGKGPGASTNAFPRLLEPTSHTTSWQPAAAPLRTGHAAPGYPTAALPARLQQ